MTRQEVLHQIATLREHITFLKGSSEQRSLMLLLSLIEQLATENEAFREERQQLLDEIARLKGEKARPSFPKSPEKKPSDHSSEKERRAAEGPPDKKKRSSKKGQLKITRQVKCPVPRESLPKDAIFKGYEKVLIQDLKIVPENTEFHKEVWYSPSLGKNFMGPLPSGYKGEYGPGIHSLLLSLKHQGGMSEPKILEFFRDHGVEISSSSLSRFLQEGAQIFEEEKKEIHAAGLSLTRFQHFDDTPVRLNGKTYYTHILCNAFFSFYATHPTKDRFSVLKTLLGENSLHYCLNEDALGWLHYWKLAHKWKNPLQRHMSDRIMNESEFRAFLQQVLPPSRGPRIERRVLEAAAIAAYHLHPLCVDFMVCDDAPQFKGLTREGIMLCWVHEGRHYKILIPFLPDLRDIHQRFLTDFWDYYRQLLQFKADPSPSAARRLERRFEELFGQKTGYSELDDRLEKTLAKKEELLRVLNYPELPLHNNPAELDARAVKRRQDVSLQLKSEAGARAQDTFLTLCQTAKKLGVSVYDYFYDRISGSRQLPSLATLIRQQAPVPNTS